MHPVYLTVCSLLLSLLFWSHAQSLHQWTPYSTPNTMSPIVPHRTMFTYAVCMPSPGSLKFLHLYVVWCVLGCTGVAEDSVSGIGLHCVGS